MIMVLLALGGFASQEDSDKALETTTDDSLGKAHEYAVDTTGERDIFYSAILILMFLGMNMWFAISTTADAADAYEQVFLISSRRVSI